MPESLQRKNIKAVINACKLAWNKNLMPGFSGNASLRFENGAFVITRSGTPKGLLKDEDFLLMDLRGNILAGAGKPSSEWRMHAALYENFPSCQALLHTHPPCLQSLDLLLDSNPNFQELFLDAPLFETLMWKPRLHFAEVLPPGSNELAQSCVAALEQASLELPCGIWMRRHGITALGNSLEDALCLTEELEHLARLQLNLAACRGGSGKKVSD